MGLFHFLLIVQTLVAAAMIALILMQRSEGGGLVSGGSPAGMMSARGAADFLTRSTAILATIFVALSILLAAIAAGQRAPATINPDLLQPAPAGAPQQRQDTPFDIVPGAPPQPPAQQAPAPAPAPAEPVPGQ